jgi:transposase-like protein
MSTRKKYTAEQKVKIVREHLVNRVPISELAARYGINPTLIHNWQKQLFEGATETFATKRGPQAVPTAKQKAREEKLDVRLRERESLISDLLLDNLRLKKNIDGET